MARFGKHPFHTSLSGREGHDTYAPTSLEVLCEKGYDYFALGHVHAREVVNDSAPRIVFPGNLQGRWSKEVGSKGCELVTVEGGVITAAEHVSLEVVRWHRIRIDASNISSVTDLARQFATQATGLLDGLRDRLHAVRVTVAGESLLHRLEAEQPGSLMAAIQAAAQDIDGCDIWIEDVRLDLRSPLDRSVAAAQTDAQGEVVRLVDSISGDETMLREWFARHLSEMKEMPGALADASPNALDLAMMRALLADAEASVLMQMSAAESTENKS